MNPKTNIPRTLLLILVRGLASGVILGLLLSIHHWVTREFSLLLVPAAIIAMTLYYVVLATLHWFVTGASQVLPFTGIFGIASGITAYSFLPISTIPGDVLLSAIASTGRLKSVLTPGFNALNMPLIVVSEPAQDEQGRPLLFQPEILLARSRHFLPVAGQDRIPAAETA